MKEFNLLRVIGIALSVFGISIILFGDLHNSIRSSFSGYYPISNEKLISLIRDVGFSNVKKEPFGEFVWFIGYKK